MKRFVPGSPIQSVPLPPVLRGLATVVGLVGLILATSPTHSQESTRGALDGLRFEGLTGEQGKGDHHADTITFENGKFRSIDCENWGFGPAPYTATRNGETFLFEAVLRSEDRGTLTWRGTITGDKAKAQFHWQHERWYWDIDRHYWFEGTRRK